MKTQFTQLENITDVKVVANAVKKSGLQHQDATLNPFVIFCRLFFAVTVIGVLGYYFDRLLHSPGFNKPLKPDRRGMS